MTLTTFLLATSLATYAPPSPRSDIRVLSPDVLTRVLLAQEAQSAPANPKPDPAQRGEEAKAVPKASPAPKNEPAVDKQQRAKRGRFSFEFAKAEVVDIVKAISDMTRRNFIIPDNLKSKKITILSPTKINASEAWQVFLTALAVNDITVSRSGKFYKLMQSKEAIKSTIPTCVGPEEKCPEYSEQMVTALVSLEHIDAQQVNNVLKGLISKEGEIAIFQPTNALIISEYATNLRRLRNIVEALDQPGINDDELKLIQIKYATAAEIADKISQVFEIQGPQARNHGRSATNLAQRRANAQANPNGEEESADVQISKIISDERTNQIIVKASRKSFEAIKRLISQLDVPIAEEDQGRVHIYYLENASAEDLASTLSSLAQGGQQRTAAQRRQQQAQNRGAAPTASPTGPESAVLFEGEVRITADASTNALIVVSSAHDFRSLKRLIEKLDRPRRQVYVEAAILEVTVTDNNSFGLSYHGAGTGIGTDGSVGFLQSSQVSGGISPTLTALADPTALLGVAGGAVGGILGDGVDVDVGNGNVLSIPAFGVILRWLQSSSKANILSTPHILTTDNEEASIEVGQRIPFQRGTSIPNLTTGTTAQTLGNLGNLFSATDRIDVSLRLNIRPTINERNKVRLEIEQDIEDLVGREETTQQPITARRNAKTVVVVDDQQTVVLGGLIRDRMRSSESKIPVLGDLPIVGWLFKQTSSEAEKVNLLLVLTPYIISERDDFQRIFERKLREHEEFAADFYGDSPEYRAHIDYTRKSGPLALLGRAIENEKSKYENGGGGDGTELLVEPRGSDTDEPVYVPRNGRSRPVIFDDPVLEPGEDGDLGIEDEPIEPDNNFDGEGIEVQEED